MAGMTSYFLDGASDRDGGCARSVRRTLRSSVEDLEFKLGVMRRLILTMDVVVFGIIGYWVGKTFAG